MDESREEIPRISIDSLRDWHRMKSNFSNAVFELFDQRIRQNGLESERASFLPHLQQFIDTTFEKAEPNVRINGKNFEEVKDGDDDKEVEPFDERRKRPQEVATLLENIFKAQEAIMGELDEPAEEEEDHLDPSLPDETMLAETVDAFSNVVGLSEGLSQTVKTQRDRVGRLKEAEEEVNAIKP
ncbi:hypothetical protein EDB92DRAFT_91068 [Lactarius akahatsu]|uniref:Uncharacterized protein n=1 Tax=Lactarius akahatsu TaxID=416441 RepID=A0AAD4LSF8_9AGAM|nr:hypothetical protein EDB92DRAFT_91068 [Lactarius akahatsu]